MLEKLVALDKTPKIDYIEDFGNYNSLPTPYEECTFAEFYREFRIYPVLYYETRQPYQDRKFLGDFSLYYYGDKGYAVEWDRTDPNKSVVYRIGCKHDWELISERRCYRSYKCTKCGCTCEVDTSD